MNEGQESHALRSVSLITKKPLLGVSISVTTYEQVVEAVLKAALRPQALRFTALDAHGLSLGARDRCFRELVNGFDIVSPDGHSLQWGLNRIYGEKLPDRVAGPDLMVRLCRAVAEKGWPAFFYGSHQYVVEGLCRKLSERFPGIQVAGSQPSRFRPATPEEDAQDIQLIRQSGARLVFVGLGCPLQEQWVWAHAASLSMPLLAVGAAFDFISGNKPRAPKWMQDAGVEWVFRIAVEPRRLVRRSLPAVAHVFCALFWQMLLHSRPFLRKPHEAAPSISIKV